MRLKSLLLLVFLAQLFCSSAFGQVVHMSDEWPKATRENNPILESKMDSRKSVFYSNAKIYVAKNEKDDGSGNVVNDASLFIQGSAIYDNASQNFQEGETSLTGDIVSWKNQLRDQGAVELLFKQDPLAKGLIRFVGEWNAQYIVSENSAGQLLHVYVHGGNPSYIFDNTYKVGNYVLNFPNIKVEKEGMLAITSLPPDLPADASIGRPLPVAYDVTKMGFVSVWPTVAMSVDELDLTGGNRFSNEVRSAGIDLYALRYKDFNETTSSSEYYRLISPYVDVKSMKEENIAGPNGAIAAAGHSEVNLRMYDYNASIDNAQELKLDGNLEDTRLQASNTMSVTLDGGSSTHASFMRGFTSPFERLRTDYMFYNVLTKPSATSITDWRNPVADPYTEIETGAGYFMAMDVSRAYFTGPESIQERWQPSNSTAFEKRARGGYNWSRVVQRVNDGIYTGSNANDDPNAGDWFSLYTFDPFDTRTLNDAPDYRKPRVYEEQRFNVGEVKVRVEGGNAKNGGGLNFLGNPFMMPIDLSGLLAEGGVTGVPTDLDPISNPDVLNAFTPFPSSTDVKALHYLNDVAVNTANSNGELLLRSKYWVVSTALVANTQIGGIPAYAYNVKYDNVDAVSTAATVIANPFDYHIEPMQMFLVQAATSGDFVFTPEMKTFEKKALPIVFNDYTNSDNVVPETRGFVSEVSPLVPQNETSGFMPNDWLVVEAIANDGGKVSVDRTAVRFYEQATQGKDIYDEEKRFFAPKNSETKTRQVKSVDSFVDQTASASNFVYTKATTGQNLLSNGVGYDTKEIPLYYVSNAEVQNVTLAITGIEGFDRVAGVSLVDRFVNGDGTEFVKKITETDFTYEFTTMPGKETVDGVNRFALRFGDDDDNELPEVSNMDPITCYYSGSTLHIGGLNKDDVGSRVQIFDLQGRMMGTTIVKNNDYPTMEYQKPLGQGTFIVNIHGERNYKTKFVNLQNY